MLQEKGFLPLLAALLLPLCLAFPAHAADTSAKAAEKKNPVLLTLEWPPYTSVKLADNGHIAKRVKAAYAALGQEAKIGFFSWRRAMRLPYTDRRFTAFFPAYPSAERKQVCHLSEPIGMSQLGLAQTSQKPLQWARTEDLKRYRLGIVTAYSNEDSLDRFIRDGSVKTVATEGDAENLLNLARGRVDAAVIDTYVFNWLMKNDARLRPWQDKLQMNERVLVTWPLFVCFRKDSEGDVLRDEFNRGLAALHESGPDLVPPAQAAPVIPEKTATKEKAPRKKI
ncbi:MAG: transporter substrate-binding domain-containing protein [Pedobacter sp.]|nr:transporter substrate-binding domain-containing protein [Pedobacter sp.]